MTVKKNFPRPKKRLLDHQQIKKFLKTINFTPQHISQPWRHLTAHGIYQNQPAVFKLASTQTTSPLTKKEYLWNQAVHLTPASKRKNFTVPQNYAFGFYHQKLFYFISQEFPSKPLAKPHQPLADISFPLIHLIAKAAFEIINLQFPSHCPFVTYQTKPNKSPPLPIGHRLLNSATEWASQVPLNLKPFLQIIEEQKNGLLTAPAHGDFVIRHMYLINNKIALIDGEHAGAKGPLYYDVAQFYLRLRNDHQATNLAQLFLHRFQKLLSPKDQKTFWYQLKPVLIQRYLGDLWGVAKKPNQLANLKPLGNQILSDKII